MDGHGSGRVGWYCRRGFRHSLTKAHTRAYRCTLPQRQIECGRREINHNPRLSAPNTHNHGCDTGFKQEVVEW